MKSIVLWFVSGYAFFTGCFFVFIGAVASFFEVNSFLMKVFSRVIIILGFFLIVFSGTPISGVLFRLTGLLALALFFAMKFSSPPIRFFLYGIRIALICCIWYMMHTEYNYWNLPKVPACGISDKVIFLLGDSISSGINFPGEKVWSKVLEEQYNIKVYNLAVKGGTINTAIKQSSLIMGENIPVIIEIGGNDIRRRRSAKQFYRDLDTLLKKITLSDRIVVMFELPTPPLYTYYTRIQRELAEKYNVYLIPKRYFAAILLGDKNTVDNIHFSNSGHKKMAQLVWETINPIFKN